jgi:hypothetical protein
VSKHHVAWLFVIALTLGSAPASAQALFGPQLSYGTDADLGIGARLYAPLMALPFGVEFTGSADYFFGDEPRGVDVSWVDLNAGVIVPVSIAPGFSPYLGGGLNLAFVSAESEEEPNLESSDTWLGINILAGWRRATTYFTPFVEVRSVIAGQKQVVFTAGVAFGGAR